MFGEDIESIEPEEKYEESIAERVKIRKKYEESIAERVKIRKQNAS